MLQSKIDKAIETLQKYEKLALKYSPSGFHVAFSIRQRLTGNL